MVDEAKTPGSGSSAAIRNAVAAAIGRDGWAALSAAPRALLEGCCADAAALQLALLGAGDDPATADRVRREKAHVDAQLASLATVGAQRVADVVWEAAAAALLRAGRAVAARAL